MYNLIREHVDAVSGPAVNVEDILPKVLARGCTKEHLAETLTEYEELGVWHLNHDRSIVRFAAAGRRRRPRWPVTPRLCQGRGGPGAGEEDPRRCAVSGRGGGTVLLVEGRPRISAPQ